MCFSIFVHNISQALQLKWYYIRKKYKTKNSQANRTLAKSQV